MKAPNLGNYIISNKESLINKKEPIKSLIGAARKKPQKFRKLRKPTNRRTK